LAYLKELTVEEDTGGNIVSRIVQIVVYPILNLSDDLGINHQLIFMGSDLDWLSEMRVSVVHQYS
jgi:hypothetical protein